MDSLGESLRRARESKGLTFDQVSDEIHINPAYLRAMEEERLDAFPADVYGRGFLRSYASFLGLDPAPLLEQFQAIRNPPAVDLPSARRRKAAALVASPSYLEPPYPDRSTHTLRRSRASVPVGRRPSRRGLPLFLALMLVVAAAVWSIRSGPIQRFIRHLHRAPTTNRKISKRSASTPRPAPAPIVHRSGGPLVLNLRSTGWVHVEVTTDTGKRRFYPGEWEPGESHTYKGRKKIGVYADVGSNLVASLDGVDVGKLAPRRRKVWKSFTIEPTPGSISLESAAAGPSQPASATPSSNPAPTRTTAASTPARAVRTVPQTGGNLAVQGPSPGTGQIR